MKKTIKNGLIQVRCKNQKQKLKALATIPYFQYSKNGVNEETFLYFKIK